MADEGNHVPTREELKNDLVDLCTDLKATEAAKKRDAELHNERIRDIKGQINTVVDALAEDDEAEKSE